MKKAKLILSSIASALALFAGAFLTGKTEMPEMKYLDKSSIIDWESTETCLIITTKDGNRYLWTKGE